MIDEIIEHIRQPTIFVTCHFQVVVSWFGKHSQDLVDRLLRIWTAALIEVVVTETRID